MRCTAFAGPRQIASGPLVEVALAVNAAASVPGGEPILVFDDASGRVVDLDLRGDDADIRARLENRAVPDISASTPDATAPRGRGRPRLGVVAREVTLLPRHWQWLAAQPGGASQALRRLVDQARRTEERQGGERARREAAYRFLSAIAGDLPAYEEAIRALFAGDEARYAQTMAAWPPDVSDYATRLAVGEGAAGESEA